MITVLQMNNDTGFLVKMNDLPYENYSDAELEVIVRELNNESTDYFYFIDDITSINEDY